VVVTFPRSTGNPIPRPSDGKGDAPHPSLNPPSFFFFFPFRVGFFQLQLSQDVIGPFHLRLSPTFFVVVFGELTTRLPQASYLVLHFFVFKRAPTKKVHPSEGRLRPSHSRTKKPLRHFTAVNAYQVLSAGPGNYLPPSLSLNSQIYWRESNTSLWPFVPRFEVPLSPLFV